MPEPMRSGAKPLISLPRPPLTLRVDGPAQFGQTFVPVRLQVPLHPESERHPVVLVVVHVDHHPGFAHAWHLTWETNRGTWRYLRVAT